MVLAEDEAKERGLAVAVPADETHALAMPDDEAYPVEDDLGAEGFREV
jgi:hypothetical protein